MDQERITLLIFSGWSHCFEFSSVSGMVVTRQLGTSILTGSLREKTKKKTMGKWLTQVHLVTWTTAIETENED